MATVDDFRSAVEVFDIEAARVLLSEDVVFHSPATFHPFRGRETVGRLLECVATVLTDFRYTDQLDAGTTHGLIFRARIGERELEGIDLLRLDEHGLIADFTVMIRPLSAMIPFAQAMGEKVAAAGIATSRD